LEAFGTTRVLPHPTAILRRDNAFHSRILDPSCDDQFDTTFARNSIKMPHPVSSESSEDIAMSDVADDCSRKTQNDPNGLAPTTADEIHDTIDKDNRNSLEDMFDDDSDDDDEFPSSAPSAHGDDNSQQERSVVSTRLCLDLL
jgi:hypothetical protein